MIYLSVGIMTGLLKNEVSILLRLPENCSDLAMPYLQANAIS